MKRFGLFWWDFTFGLMSVSALSVTALLATTWTGAWIVLPLAVAAMLWLSLRRVAA